MVKNSTNKLFLGCLAAGVLLSSPARADGECLIGDFLCSSEQTRDTTYIYSDFTNREAYRAPLRRNDWHPEDWISQRDSASELVQGFYDAGIISDQYKNDKGMPILAVGPNFYHLSHRNQHRLARTMAYLYNPGKADIFYLSDWYSQKIIASYHPGYGLTRSR